MTIHYSQMIFCSECCKEFPERKVVFHLFGSAIWIGNGMGCIYRVLYFHASAAFRIIQDRTIFLKNDLYAYASILLLFFPLLFHTLGLNELHSSEFSATLASDTFSAWAILSWLQGKLFEPTFS